MVSRLLAVILLITLLAACSKTEEVKVYDDAGNLIEQYRRNKEDYAKEGAFMAFYPEGKKLEEAFYVRDTLEGVRRLYYPDGQVQIEEHYRMGSFEGPYRSYYDNGQLELEGLYENSSMTGTWKRYYQSGQLMEEVLFVDNQENGPFVEYHENGKLKARGTYLGGDFEHGLLELYDENGELEKKMECDRGVCHTVWERSAEN